MKESINSKIPTIGFICFWQFERLISSGYLLIIPFSGHCFNGGKEKLVIHFSVISWERQQKNSGELFTSGEGSKKKVFIFIMIRYRYMMLKRTMGKGLEMRGLGHAKSAYDMHSNVIKIIYILLFMQITTTICFIYLLAVIETVFCIFIRH